MKSSRAVLSLLFSVALVATPAIANTTHTSSTVAAHSKSTRRVTGRSHGKASRRVAKSHKLHGQQAIDSERVTQIQQALIRAHYMTGDANGQWDASTQAAMQKYQSDQGWQTRLLPDSRALVKLGLGPDYSTAINARNAGSTASAETPAVPASQTTGFAAASGVNQ